MDDLTRIQRRELMWLAAHTDARGNVVGNSLDARCGSGDVEFSDIARRYKALEAHGFVDRLLFADDSIYMARLTEEGRDAAEAFLEQELKSELVPEDVKKTVRDSLVGNAVSAAFKALLFAVGFA